ncbi:T9SS type A sorting domain-containing protein [Wenyingzhuangia aestuarii]|uniref:T9SS type A sorting domain-containing protein n=1 Tax=Wenyingzhuangia aestuarii TaxID=1647582 RepID=UPI00143CA3CD|nr:T9SS type A sorting domain-containing protein [Wenyingzhuangia aestuarii]NJB82842.1 hypothetical protein [Wenyingzhuangia aestuarii]
MKNFFKIKLLLCSLLLMSIYTYAQNFYPKAPILITPEEDWNVTKEALSFRFVAPNNQKFLDTIKNNFSVNKSGSSVNLLTHNKQKAVYRVQISKSTSFGGTNKVYNKHIKLWSRQHGTTQHIPNVNLAAGTYYWRMRCETLDAGTVNVGPWSVKRKLILVNTPVSSNQRYNITNKNPLFVIADADPNRIVSNDTNLFSDFGKNAFSKNDFSSGKRKHVAVIVDDRTKTPDRFANADNYSINAIKNNLDKIKNWGYKTMVFHQYSLAEQDWIYQNYENCIGTFTGETEDLVRRYQNGGNDGFNDETFLYLKKSLKLARIHGGYFMNATHYANNALIAKDHEPYFHSNTVNNLLENEGSRLILGTKNNSAKAKHILDSYHLGLWLDDKIGNICIWMENYYNRSLSSKYPSLWKKINNSDSDTYTPVTQMAKEMLYGAANGGTVFVIRDNDNSTDINGTRSVLRDHLFKLFEKIIDEDMIPSKNKIRAKNNKSVEFVTINKNGGRDTDNEATFYQKYEALYDQLFGIKNFNNEKIVSDVIPDNGGRYGMFPITSKNTTGTTWTGVTRYLINSVDTAAEVSAIFTNTAPHSGNAWVSKTDDKYIILNSLETDLRKDDSGNLITNKQNFKLSFEDTNFIKKFDGEVNISTYIGAKLLEGGNKLRFFVNSHRYNQYIISKNKKTVDLAVENTVVSVFANQKPNITVVPAQALVGTPVWNAAKKKFTVTLKHLKSFDDIVTVEINKPTTTSVASESEHFLSVDFDAKNNEIGIFPNPVKGQVNFSGSFQKWKIKNIAGQLIKTGIINTVNTSEFVPGLYFVIFDDKVVEKLIVQ